MSEQTFSHFLYLKEFIVKKFVSVVALIALAASVFAAGMDTGFGVNYGGLTSTATGTVTLLGSSTTTATATKYTDLDFNAYLTVDYVQFGVGYMTLKNNGGTVTVGGSSSSFDASSESYTYLPLYLVGRYPLKLGRQFSFVPMAGLQYAFCIASTNSSGNAVTSDLSSYNRFSGLLGFAFDISLGKNLVLRPQFICDITIEQPYETTAINNAKSSIGSSGTSLKYFDYTLKGGISIAYKL